MERWMLKLIHVQLYAPERPHWHGGIKKHWPSSGIFLVNFDKIPHLFLVFHCSIWGSVAGCVYQQWSKYRHAKIVKHASTGTNYAILTKQVKVQNEKKFVLKYVECRFWANIYKIYLRFSFHKNNFFIGKKAAVETILVAINDSSDVLCFILYLINIFEKSTKVERCTDVMFKLILYYLSGTVEDLNS